MKRPEAIVEIYLEKLNAHIEELKLGKAEKTYKIEDIAELMHLHPRHLSNTIHQTLGKSPCALYEEKLLEISKELLLTTPLKVAEIARRLTYDPSNFGKFFKSYTGVTPKQFRKNALTSI